MVLLATVFVVVWGLISYLGISRREDPEIRISTAMVITIYPGASAEKVEQQVTRKLEESIESMDTLKELASTTRENISVISVTVRYDCDSVMEWQKLRSRVVEAKKDLPDSIVGPTVWDEFGDTTAMIVTLNGADPVTLADLAKELKAELRSVGSVGTVTIYGEIPEVVYLEGNRADLARYGVTPARIAEALKMHNVRIPAGTVRTERFQYRVEPTGAYRTVEEIGDTILDVSTETGQPVHVRDLFEVRRALKSPVETKVLEGGKTTVAVGLVMKKGFNIVAMGTEVRRLLDRFRPRLPSGVSMKVVHDSPRQVNDNVSHFMMNLVEGLVIVVLMMAIFLGIRSAVISAVAIPLSVLIAIAVMPAMKVDLEFVSIAAFIVALGMLVDDNIIVTDNVDVKIREGTPVEEAAWRGPHDLAGPIVVGTLATVIAYFPMLLLHEEIGAYVRSLPLVVSVSMLGSLLVSFTVTPLMAKRMMSRGSANAKPFGQGPVARGYRRFMGACLRHRLLVVGVTLAALIGSGVLLVAIGFSFFPDANRDQFFVDIWLKEGSSVEETERIARKAEATLRKDPEVVGTVVYVGEGGPRFYITVKPEFQKANYGQIMVNTKIREATSRVIDRFNATARASYPGARVFAHQMIMGMPIEAPIALRVVGTDLKTLNRISAEIQEILRSTAGTDQVRDDVGPDVPSLKVVVDTERANRVGVTNTDVALAFLSTYQGFELTRFNEGDREIPIVLKLRENEQRVDTTLGDLPVASNLTGEKVPLANIASILPEWGPGVIKRYNSRRAVTVLSWTRNRLASAVMKEVWPRIETLKLPPGYKVEISGEKEEMDKTFRDLLIVFGVIIASLLGIEAIVPAFP